MPKKVNVLLIVKRDLLRQRKDNDYIQGMISLSKVLSWHKACRFGGTYVLLIFFTNTCRSSAMLLFTCTFEVFPYHEDRHMHNINPRIDKMRYSV